MHLEYTVKKSPWAAITFWRVVGIIVIIPAILMVVDFIKLSFEKIEFYSDQIIYKKGVFNRTKTKSAFLGITAVNVNQSLLGRICNFGDVKIDVIGHWNINTDKVSNPHKLVDYLSDKIVKNNNVTTVIHQ